MKEPSAAQVIRFTAWCIVASYVLWNGIKVVCGAITVEIFPLSRFVP